MPLHFELVTPEKLVRSQEVHSVVVPGSEGEFTVLQDHAPLMTTIKDGELRVYASADAAAESISIKGGFAEVHERGLTVLAESAEG